MVVDEPFSVAQAPSWQHDHIWHRWTAGWRCWICNSFSEREPPGRVVSRTADEVVFDRHRKRRAQPDQSPDQFPEN